MHIEDLVTEAHRATVEKGFKTWGQKRPVAEHVALLVTEIGELYEEERDGVQPADFWYEYAHGERSRFPENDERAPGKPVGIAFELADLVIRAADFAGEHGIDLEQAIREKMAYNRTRPAKHGRHS